MSISAIGASTDVTSLLRGASLSLSTLAVVSDDIEEITQSGSTVSARTLDTATFQAALSARIDEDVASGQLSESEAAKVKQALGLTSEDGTDTASDETEASSGTQAANTVAAPSGGGGGSGGESEKTEVSRSETIANGIKTTVIVYDDGSSETQVSYTMAPNTPPEPLIASAYGQDDAESYLFHMTPGTFVDIAA
ncbi:hypothetical protein MTR62_07140 [Novosphingobium sp. 1949]|uniref:Uncharacterized protein n=1 Tax=Novosphingobium organovorum TaxID=2930092 RepID=A0ABT0BBN0_9SPHN|nr:hypothetical protein [Novosphingobium organovorum]MCJ2182470.1 hypothetical protein [Novosphingobium organovorum]